jgi:hypothetical protein
LPSLHYLLKTGGAESVIFNLGKSSLLGYQVEIIETLEVGIWKDYFKENNFKVKSIVKKVYFSHLSFKTDFRFFILINLMLYF